jgi:hypothetical protein
MRNLTIHLEQFHHLLASTSLLCPETQPILYQSPSALSSVPRLSSLYLSFVMSGIKQEVLHLAAAEFPDQAGQFPGNRFGFTL